MNEFQCIGADCSDTCCSGWRVDIDKRTYKKYQKIKDKDMATKINELVKKTKSQDDSDYAYIQSVDGGCGFLENGLCGIQLKYGEEYLSRTCLTYPRAFNVVDSQVELSAKLSCPEVARLALLNREIMEFDYIEESFNTKHQFQRNIETSKNVWNSCFWEIRTLTIDILQNRNYSVSERLIALGLFCKKLTAVASSDQKQLILNTVEEYRTRIENLTMKEQINVIPKATHVQISLIIEMILYRGSINHHRLNEFLLQTKQAFALETMEQQKVEKLFNEGEIAYYKPFINEHSYILENFLVNQVFDRLFLFGENSNILEDYILLVSLYSMVRFLIQGVASHDKGMTPENAVSIIQSFSKAIEHNPNYLKLLTDRIMNANFEKWALLITLVKE